MNFVNLELMGSEEDGVLKGAFPLYENQIIYENSIYEIGPIKGEKKSNTPNFVHRLIINQGANNSLVGQTVFQILQLVKSHFIDSEVDTSKLLSISLEILQVGKV